LTREVEMLVIHVADEHKLDCKSELSQHVDKQNKLSKTGGGIRSCTQDQVQDIDRLRNFCDKYVESNERNKGSSVEDPIWKMADGEDYVH